ncbi:MAG: hypothetical protein JOZ48_11510 [Acidobacteriaceae bacterium]|nr:hypothetical protein [Acidobacteriaceae bacterium]MBV9765461.1 hypothetical protein [Acidobacteriaceae bacterium]
MKVYPVLGIKGEHFAGETMVKSGASMSVFCYYVVEFFGDSHWDIAIKDGTTVADLVVRNVFEQKARARIVFKEITLEQANRMVANIADIDARTTDAATSEETFFSVEARTPIQ